VSAKQVFSVNLCNGGVSELVEDGFGEDEPVEVRETGVNHGGFQLVGNGSVTNDRCGLFSSFWGCVRAELHGLKGLENYGVGGKDYSGKVYAHPVFLSCDKPSCPVCYERGWGNREARKIEVRLAEASKKFGLVEHIIATVPPRFYGLDYAALRLKVVKSLRDRGVIGGVMIFHGFRYNNFEEARRKGVSMGWFWATHFHVLGFILGGYSCRSCKKKCFKGCGGFRDRSFRCFERDGCVVKVAVNKFGVAGKRDSVGGTAAYQLEHATLKVGAVRFHVATWFGVCSYRKLKVSAELKKQVCPICEHELVKLRYFGDIRFCLDRASPEYQRDLFVDVEENGRVVWFEDVKNGG